MDAWRRNVPGAAINTAAGDVSDVPSSTYVSDRESRSAPSGDESGKERAASEAKKSGEYDRYRQSRRQKMQHSASTIDSKLQPKPMVTQMWRHQNRVLKCRHCRADYVATQNTSQSCEYHPGTYRTACPRTCPHFASGKPNPSTCMTHYKRRWSW